MALIENLVVTLGLKSTQFNTGIKGAKQELTGFEKATAAVSGKLAGFAKSALLAVAGFIGIRSVFQNISSAMAELDDIGKTAAKLGIATEHLMGLRFGAGLAGIEISKFDTAFQKMLINIADASKGKGESLDAFAKLGLDAKTLFNLTPDKQIRKIADELMKVGNATERVDLAYKIFGRSGVSMLNLLKDGAKGLDAVQKKAEELGLVFSTLDIAKVEMANDEWSTMKQVISAVWKNIAIELSPAIILFSRQTTNLVLAAAEFGRTFGASAENVVKIIGVLVDATVLASAQLRIVANTFGMIVAYMGALVPGQYAGAMGQVEEYEKKIKKVQDDFAKALGHGFGKEMEAELARIKKEFENMKQKDREGALDVGAGSENLFPGAFQRGTREAAAAAAKAGGRDRAVEYAQQSVFKLSSIDAKTERTNRTLDGILSAFGLEAGIV